MTQDKLAAAKAEAREAFLSHQPGRKNCAQATLLFSSRMLDIEPQVDIARYLGGGIGRSGLTCGLITGAALSLALRDMKDPVMWGELQAVGQAQIQQLIADFQTEFGATSCSGLTGCDLSDPTEYERFQAEGINETTCARALDWAADRLAGLL